MFVDYNNLNFRQLHIFLMASATESFTDAADKMNYTVSAISRSISSLEAALGIQLFFRFGRNIRLTPAGKEFAEEVKYLMQHFERSISRVLSTSFSTGKELKVGTFAFSNVSMYYRKVLEHYKKLCPDISVRITTGDFLSMSENFSSSNYDVFYVAEPMQSIVEMSGYKFKLLYPGHACVVYSAEHPLFIKKRVSINDFKEDTIVVMKNSSLTSFYYRVAIDFFQKNGFSSKKILFAGSLEELLFYIESGSAIALLDSTASVFLGKSIKMIEVDIEAHDRFGFGIALKDDKNPILNQFVESSRAILEEMISC